jgi:hypothetical protein
MVTPVRPVPAKMTARGRFPLIYVSLIISIVGLIVYAFSNQPKVMAIALDCFWVGLLVFLARWNGHIS